MKKCLLNRNSAISFENLLTLRRVIIFETIFAFYDSVADYSNDYCDKFSVKTCLLNRNGAISIENLLTLPYLLFLKKIHIRHLWQMGPIGETHDSSVSVYF